MTNSPSEASAAPLAAGWNGSPGTGEEERIAGRVSYLEVLARLHRALRPVHYLEIGVRHGASLSLALGAATGVDPAPAIDRDLPSTTQVVELTSDAFFARSPQGPPPDFCFIDGMHLLEYALRDFVNCERYAAANAVVVFDDIFPNHPAQAERERRTRVWTGDVWRIAQTLRLDRPDLFVASIDASPAGLLLVAGLDSQDRRLFELCEKLAREPPSACPLPRQVIDRVGSLDPDSPAFDRLLAALAEFRASGASSRQGLAELRRIGS